MECTQNKEFKLITICLNILEKNIKKLDILLLLWKKTEISFLQLA